MQWEMHVAILYSGQLHTSPEQLNTVTLLQPFQYGFTARPQDYPVQLLSFGMNGGRNSNSEGIHLNLKYESNLVRKIKLSLKKQKKIIIEIF